MKSGFGIALALIACVLAGCAGPGSRVSSLPLNPLPADGVPVLTVAQVSTYPVITRDVKAHWPLADRFMNVGGNVMVDMVVDEEGTPRNIQVTQSSSPEFARPALLAAARWRFTPGRVNGKPVRTRVQIPFDIGWTSHEKGPDDHVPQIY